MTPQDIREKIFEKAVFGGYDMGSVDDFMEEMASELEAAQRESATLKAKMKVLVDKIEEDRASEDAMRMTLLSAQKLSSQIEAEARARADKVVAEAQAAAARSLDGLKSETRREEARLQAPARLPRRQRRRHARRPRFGGGCGRRCQKHRGLCRPNTG